MTYTAEEEEFAESHPSLGAEYKAADAAARRFLAHWEEEHAEKLMAAIMNPVLNTVRDQVWSAFQDWLLCDAEYNAANEMRRMVENSVNALIGGREWASVKYIRPGAYRSEEVRATLAKLYSDEIKDARIADLEAEIERLKESLRFARS
jgi:hypothetical protein